MNEELLLLEKAALILLANVPDIQMFVDVHIGDGDELGDAARRLFETFGHQQDEPL